MPQYSGQATQMQTMKITILTLRSIRKQKRWLLKESDGFLCRSINGWACAGDHGAGTVMWAVEITAVWAHGSKNGPPTKLRVNPIQTMMMPSVLSRKKTGVNWGTPKCKRTMAQWVGPLPTHWFVMANWKTSNTFCEISLRSPTFKAICWLHGWLGCSWVILHEFGL